MAAGSPLTGNDLHYGMYMSLRPRSTLMGDWGLPSDTEVHMRQITLTSIREAGAALMSGADFY